MPTAATTWPIAFPVAGLVATLTGLKSATGHGLDSWWAWTTAAVLCWLVIMSVATTRTMPEDSRSAVFRYFGSALLLMGATLHLMK